MVKGNERGTQVVENPNRIPKISEKLEILLMFIISHNQDVSLAH